MKKLMQWSIDDIIEWCAANNQLDWLEAESNKKVTHKVYPQVESVSKAGKKSWKLDKSAEPVLKEEPITFIELRHSFYTKFIDSTPPKTKVLTMQEKIAAAIAAKNNK